MKTLGIAELKARLCQHLRAVRAGESLVVLDRRTPVARIVPYSAELPGLRIRAPSTDAPRLSQLPRPEPIPEAADAVKLLLADREKGR